MEATFAESQYLVGWETGFRRCEASHNDKFENPRLLSRSVKSGGDPFKAVDQRYNCKEASLGAGWAIHPANAQVAGNNIRFALMEFPLFTVSFSVKIVKVSNSSSSRVISGSRVLILEESEEPPLGREWVVSGEEKEKETMIGIGGTLSLPTLYSN